MKWDNRGRKKMHESSDPSSLDSFSSGFERSCINLTIEVTGMCKISFQRVEAWDECLTDFVRNCTICIRISFASLADRIPRGKMKMYPISLGTKSDNLS